MNEDVDMATLFTRKKSPEQMDDKELAEFLGVSEERVKLFNRLCNYKFETAERYLDGSGLASHERELVKYLCDQYGNCGWICGKHSILIDAALRSLPKYLDYMIAVKAWQE